MCTFCQVLRADTKKVLNSNSTLMWSTQWQSTWERDKWKYTNCTCFTSRLSILAIWSYGSLFVDCTWHWRWSFASSSPAMWTSHRFQHENSWQILSLVQLSSVEFSQPNLHLISSSSWRKSNCLELSLMVTGYTGKSGEKLVVKEKLLKMSPSG